MGRKKSKALAAIEEEDEFQTPEDDEPENEEVPNAGCCPLFIGAKGATKNNIEHLKVHKLDPPGEGFKGVAPRYVDEVYIAKRWGNGMYRIEACNEKGGALRVKNLSLALDLETPDSGLALRDSMPMGVDAEVLAAQNDQHNKDVDRFLEFSKDHSEKLAATHKESTGMISATHAASAQRDRAFFETQRDAQSGFFQSMYTQSQQSHQQAMQMAQENFKQTMLMMQAVNVQSAQANNPAMLMSVLMKGLEMGQGMASDDDGDPEWLKAVTVGVDGIKSLAGMSIPMKNQALPNPGAAPPAMLPAQGAPPAAAAPATVEKLFEKEDLDGIVAFKKLCNEKGVDFAALLEQAKDQVSSLPDDFEEDEEGQEGQEGQEGEELNEDEGTETTSELAPSDGNGAGSADNGQPAEGALGAG